MAMLGPNFRRIRITGAPTGPHRPGQRRHYRTTLTDIDSGEEITNITRIVLDWRIGTEPIAELRYYAVDAAGQMIGYDHLIEETVSIVNPEVLLSSEPVKEES